jgi:hypothetical protein
MSRHYGRWNEEEIKRLLELDKMGETDLNIAKILKRTEASIRSKLSTLRTKKKKVEEFVPPPTKSVWDRIMDVFR